MRAILYRELGSIDNPASTPEHIHTEFQTDDSRESALLSGLSIAASVA